MNFDCIINLQHTSGNPRAIYDPPQPRLEGVGLAAWNPANAANGSNLDMGLKRPAGRFNGEPPAQHNCRQLPLIYPAFTFFLPAGKILVGNTILRETAFLSLRLSLICIYGVILFNCGSQSAPFSNVGFRCVARVSRLRALSSCRGRARSF